MGNNPFILIVIVMFIGLWIGLITGKLVAESKINRTEYTHGWDDAKKFFYTDVKEEQRNEREEQERRERLQQESLSKENTQRPPVPSDLLIAFGVSNAGQLPDEVRKFYGIVPGGDNDVDIETLIERETDTTEVR